MQMEMTKGKKNEIWNIQGQEGKQEKELPHQKDLKELSKGCQICHSESLKPVTGRRMKLEPFPHENLDYSQNPQKKCISNRNGLVIAHEGKKSAKPCHLKNRGFLKLVKMFLLVPHAQIFVSWVLREELFPQFLS